MDTRAPPISGHRNGADILVEALEREGVTHVFAYPGGASIAIHHALVRSTVITNHLFRHEQAEVFAAEGFSRATGTPGVCIATSGPGFTNLVTGIADAFLDSIPLLAITGQVASSVLGTSAFQEVPTVDISRPITKRSYLVMDASDIPRVVQEAFKLATSGRQGPVLIDIPIDVQRQLVVPIWNLPTRLQHCTTQLPKPPEHAALVQVMELLERSKKPVLYVGGGAMSSSAELRQFAELTGIPVAMTLMGLGVYPADGDLSLKMLGMHGTVYANYAVEHSDLLLAFGVRFDDRVTGYVNAFASRAKIVHVDIDRKEIGKIKPPFLSINGDLKLVLQGMNHLLESVDGRRSKLQLDFLEWRAELEAQKIMFSLRMNDPGYDMISPQYAITILDELTHGEAIISTGVGQHQMWAAQWYTHRNPRSWLSSAGLGAMGFGLPAAAGAAIGRPGEVVVDIDGDGSFLMNLQELATIKVEELPVKMMIINNQHLGMMVQWEERILKPEMRSGCAFLGDPRNTDEVYPDFVAIARGFGVRAARVRRRSEVREAVREMLESEGPYLLDVVVPVEEQVLPMIPSNGTFRDIIT